MTQPYISFVLVGRNDNYGGDFRQRLQHCVSNLYTQLERFEISAEIIFVNYNPLPEPIISEFIDWPSSKGKIAMRIIEVAEKVHTDFLAKNEIQQIPVLEYLAKNIGIRRSKGQFIACINPDVSLPDELFLKIKDKLNKNAYYKANRLDVIYGLHGETVKFVRMNLKGHAFPVTGYSSFKNLWWKWKFGIVNFYKFNTPHFKYIFDLLKITVYYHHAEFKYHCMAGGDLMLMHRDVWFSIKAYHEKNFISLHTDSLMTIQAATFGLEEQVLYRPILHEEHERRFSSDRNDRLQENAYLFFQQEAKEMLKQKKNKIYNNDDWGLVKFDLPEITVK